MGINKLNVGDEVYMLKRQEFGTIFQIDESVYYITNEDNKNSTCERSEIIPTNFDLVEKDEPNLTTLMMAGRIPGKLIVDNKPSLIVVVGSDERNVPHFHIFRSDKDFRSWSNGACLMFTENRYFDHGSRNKETLSKYELTAINMKLKSIYKEYNVTYWKHLINCWNASNSDYPIPNDLPITKYDFKTIKKYKDKS